MISDIEDYFMKGCGRCGRFATSACSARIWTRGLTKLRVLCREAGLGETAKWGHPCYIHAGRNIAIIGAFQDNYRLSFFNAALMQDPDGVLVRQGPNATHPDMIRFDCDDGPDHLSETITAYLHEAMGYADAKQIPAKDTSKLQAPEELLAALERDPELAAAFHALTPGRQKSYVLNVLGAKKPETRARRIEKFRPKILQGKGANEY